MNRSDQELIASALLHIEALDRHLERGDLDDETVADAVCLRLAAAIDAVSETSPAFRKREFGHEWKEIWATRNRIAHGYASINLTLIQNTIEQDLPDFRRKLDKSLIFAATVREP